MINKLMEFWNPPPTHHGSARLVSARAAGLKQVFPNRISWTLGAAGWRGTSYGIDTYPTGQHAAVIGPLRRCTCPNCLAFPSGLRFNARNSW